MKWTEKEAEELAHSDIPLEHALAIASRAVELVRARGGTMTAERVKDALARFSAAGHQIKAARLEDHLAAQGSRIAALEQVVLDAQATRSDLEGMLAASRRSVDMLQQHVSELEKSLENARTERDEARGAMATASSERDRIATSYQDLIRERAGYMKAVNERDAAVAHVKLLTVEVERLDLALRASETNISRASGDLAAAVADNAPLLALLNRWHAWAMGSGALDTSLDPLFQDSCAVLAKPHPGAALLERMKRLETVLRNLRCIAVSQGVSEQHGVITDADALLAMKGAEECTDASCDRCRGGHPCH